MESQPAFGFKELLAHIVGDMAKAVCERPGETRQRQLARSQAAAHMIMGFLPRDVVEAMLAGHCVMLHELLIDSIRDTLRGEADPTRRSIRAGIVALEQVFGANLGRLDRYQNRRAEGHYDACGEGRREHGRGAKVHRPEGHRPEGHRDEAEALVPETKAEVEAPCRQPTPETPAFGNLASETPARETLAPGTSASGTSAPGISAPEPLAARDDLPAAGNMDDELQPIVFHPSAETIASCRANPEAMAALDAGDAERFARAMGIDMPREAYIAAASAQLAAFNRRDPAPATTG